MMRDAWIGKNRGRRRGSGTLEILIAFSVIILAITAAISVAFGNQGVTVDTELDHQAFYKATRELEKVRAAALADFDAVSSSPAELLALSEGEYNSIYTKQIGILDISPCAKAVTSTITWQVDVLRPQKVELASVVVSPEELFALGGDCSALPPEDDWENPDTANSIDISPAGNDATDVDVVKRGGNKVAFITARKSPDANDDFWAIDINDPQNLSILGSTSTGPGLNALDVAGDYAFAANNDSVNQLHVIDVSDPTDPHLVASSSLSGADASAISIAYYHDEDFAMEDRVYIGTASDPDGPEFFVFDVSNPENPNQLGGIELGRDVNAVEVDGDGYAYLATSADTAEITVIDISSPGSMSQAAVFNIRDTDGNPSNMDATSLALVGNRLYVGRERAVGAKERDFVILNVTSPAAPAELGGKRLKLNPGTEVSGIAVSGKFAFLAINDPNDGFHVWIISDPTNIVAPSACNIYNFSQHTTGLDYMDNFVYTSNESNDAFRVIKNNTSETCDS